MIADRLTRAGLEVSRLEHIHPSLDRIVTARITSVAPHPTAGRLSVCTVAAGGQDYTVVCGAGNIREGDLVPLALPGARPPALQGPIEATDIHGILSEGALCSEYELGLSSEHSGVMILPAGTEVGLPLHLALPLEDHVLDIEVTPNRPDCLSVIGIAREIAALTRETLRYPSVVLLEDEEQAGSAASVEIEDPGGCHRYVARLIKGLSVCQSPFSLRRTLHLVGIRPINIVVDITNYVMWEYGQPLHAFDLDRLAGRRIVVRRARRGERLVTLDGVERPLCEEDLVICDGSGPVALAGVMGGKHTEITDKTTSVLLESAFFDPRSIRATAKRLGLATEASYRFEREVDVEGALRAADRAAEMMKKLAGGRVLKGAIDIRARRPEPRTIRVHLGRLNRLLGTAVGKEEAADLLGRLEMGVKVGEEAGAAVMDVTPPSFRPDIRLEVDVAEEVARLFHYDRIPAVMPSVPAAVPSLEQARRLESRIRHLLVQAGFHETIHYSFVSLKHLSALSLGEQSEAEAGRAVKLLNPLSEEHAYLRTSLIGGLTETAAKNVRRMNTDLRLFEIGKVFHPRPGERLPEVRRKVAAVMTGRRYPEHWSLPRDHVDFFDIKGVVETLLSALGYDMNCTVPHEGVSFLYPGCLAEIAVHETPLGVLGKVHPGVLGAFEIDRDVYAFEIDIATLESCLPRERRYRPFSRYPPIQRDLSLIVDGSVPFSRIFEKMRALADSRVTSIHLFDVYRGKPVPEGKMSMAFRITYQDHSRTLTDEEVNRLQENYIQSLLPALGAQLRDA
jgi:phenylalanyl-tRNA synthetase beta chain